MKISVIIPAFNEERSIGKVITDIPKELVHEIIVVDNACTDRTVEVAESAGARVVREERRAPRCDCVWLLRHDRAREQKE